MVRFVKDFQADYQALLVERINFYAESNNLKIIQVSYDDNPRGLAKALVVFEKQNKTEY